MMSTEYQQSQQDAFTHQKDASQNLVVLENRMCFELVSKCHSSVSSYKYRCFMGLLAPHLGKKTQYFYSDQIVDQMN
jgi:hypothetical protein